jgi:hypothetical protein
VCQSILTPLHLFCLFVCFVCCYFSFLLRFSWAADAHGELATRVTQTGTSQGARLSSLSDRIDDVAKECLDTISMHANDVGQAVGRLERGTASSIKDAEDRLQLRVCCCCCLFFFVIFVIFFNFFPAICSSPPQLNPNPNPDPNLNPNPNPNLNPDLSIPTQQGPAAARAAVCAA